MPFKRGDVVVLQRARAAIVWSVQADALWLIPVWGCNGPPRHRAEVRIEDLAEIVACGLSIRIPVARCEQAFQLPIARLKTTEPLGCAPAGLVARLVRAMTREAQARADEDRLSFMRPLFTETLPLRP